MFRSFRKNCLKRSKSTDPVQQTLVRATKALLTVKDIFAYKKEQGIQDKYSLFGEQASFKLRKLTTERVRNIIQYKINIILYETEMGMFNIENPASPPALSSLYFSHRLPYSQLTCPYPYSQSYNVWSHSPCAYSEPKFSDPTGPTSELDCNSYPQTLPGAAPITTSTSSHDSTQNIYSAALQQLFQFYIYAFLYIMLQNLFQ